MPCTHHYSNVLCFYSFLLKLMCFVYPTISLGRSEKSCLFYSICMLYYRLLREGGQLVTEHVQPARRLALRHIPIRLRDRSLRRHPRQIQLSEVRSTPIPTELYSEQFSLLHHKYKHANTLIYVRLLIRLHKTELTNSN